MRKIGLIILAVFFLAACTPSDLPPNPGTPGADGTPVGKAIAGFEGYSEPNTFVVSPSEIMFTLGNITTTNVSATVTGEQYVYKTGYVLDASTNSWVQYSFDQPTIGLSNWIQGDTSTTLTIDLASLNININETRDLYAIAYACSKMNETWDCHENKWMIRNFKAQLGEANMQCTTSIGPDGSVWHTQGCPFPIIVNTIEHTVEVLDITEAGDACQVKVDDVVSIIDNTTSNVVNGVNVTIIDTKIIPHVVNGTDIRDFDQCAVIVPNLGQPTVPPHEFVPSPNALNSFTQSEVCTDQNNNQINTISGADDAFTTTAWIHPSSCSGAILTKSVAYVDQAGDVIMELSPSCHLSFAVNVGGWFPSFLYSGNAVIPTDAWTFVAVSHSTTGGVKLYVNGTLDVSNAGTSYAELNSHNVRVGMQSPNVASCPGWPCYPVGERPVFNGDIDDVRVYDAELSSSDITAVMNGASVSNEKKITCTNPIPSVCTDTESTADYSVQGTIDISPDASGGESSDYCVDSSQLKEYSCNADGTANETLYTCPNGCVSGACSATPQVITKPDLALTDIVFTQGNASTGAYDVLTANICNTGNMTANPPYPVQFTLVHNSAPIVPYVFNTSGQFSCTGCSGTLHAYQCGSASMVLKLSPKTNIISGYYNITAILDKSLIIPVSSASEEATFTNNVLTKNNVLVVRVN